MTKENIKPKPRGRPVGYRKENPQTKSFTVFTTPGQLTIYKDASRRAGQTFSAWVRSALDKAAKKV